MNDDIFEQWLSEPFPRGSENDKLDELHSDLAYVDAMVASTIIPYLKRGVFDEHPYLDRDEICRIVDDSRAFRTHLPEERERAEQYARYGSVLLRALEAYITARSPRGKL